MRGFQSITLLLGLSAICVFRLMASYPMWTMPEQPELLMCGLVDSPYPDERLALPAGHQGLSLYESNCTVCHGINEQVVGPPLRDIHLRMDSVMLRDWIMNSQKVIQSGDEYAVALYNEYNKTQMPAFSFSEEDLTQLIEYLKAASGVEVYVPADYEEILIAD
ncbi:MAG: cytochrome c [Cyclobacteriaceae bacterium]